MEILLVRHGETDGNVARRHQLDKTPLTPKGRKQAENVAKQIVELKPTHLVTSNLVRAIETARIIGDKCDLIPETTEHFIELSRPDFLRGHYHFSLRSVWFYFQWYFGVGIGKTEGESYEEVLKRIKIAQRYMRQFPNKGRIVVVSHSVFINLFIAHLCHDKKMTFWQSARAFWKIATMKNTQVTPILFDSSAPPNTCAWSVDKWLDS